jgi:hypothetical protein
MTVPSAGDAAILPSSTPPGLAETTIAPAPTSPAAPSSPAAGNWSAPPAGGDNPFGGGAAAPPPKPPANPFGDPTGGSPFSGGSSGTSLNPYASPSGAAFTHPFVGESHGYRPGLPWETKKQNLQSWWETAKLCMMQPSYAFSIMRLDGGMGQPMLYAGLGLGIGFLAQLAWNIPMVIVMGLAMGNGQEAATFIGVQIVSTVVQGAIGVVVGATVGLLIGTAIVHVCLMLLGGARQSFEATLRTLAYAQGATAWLNVIPFVGPIINGIWALVIEIIGLSRAHDIPVGKAILAVFLPLIVCCGLIILIAGGIGAFAAMQN